MRLSILFRSFILRGVLALLGDPYLP
jgi:hypothetical protein